MSISSINALAFYKEVRESGVIWGIKDNGGFPAPKNSDGQRAMPFWSSKSKALSIIENVPAYKHFQPVAISWAEFIERWVPGLTQDGMLVGINWSGKNASGYDLEPVELQKNVERQSE